MAPLDKGRRGPAWNPRGGPRGGSTRGPWGSRRRRRHAVARREAPPLGRGVAVEDVREDRDLLLQHDADAAGAHAGLEQHDPLQAVLAEGVVQAGEAERLEWVVLFKA